MTPPDLPDPAFWARQRVFLTGHTGFKGAWVARWLVRMGARVTGFALPPDTEPALYPQLDFPGLVSRLGDLRDGYALAAAVAAARPTVALHMAAQPLVRRSYRDPAETWSVNVMGTLNVLGALREAPDLRAVLVVTTDKVYRNAGGGRAFREGDPLGGHDPYSSSKAACEELVASYRRSFYEAAGVALATARAGNVIGGGDWAEDRLVPDLLRAADAGRPLVLRHPEAVRPWQHVLDALAGYLVYLEAMAGPRWPALPRALNFAPAEGRPMTVDAVADALGVALGVATPWRRAAAPGPAEMAHLALDPALAGRALGWRARLSGREAVDWTAGWIAATRAGTPPQGAVDAQIDAFCALRRSGRIRVSA